MADGCQHHFRIRMATEKMSQSLQIPTQSPEIINLSVEHKHKSAARRLHGLMTLRREIDNSQAPMPQRESGIPIDPGSDVIWSSMEESIGHAQHNCVQFINSRPAGEIEKSR
jgi:hypothetical protein